MGETFNDTSNLLNMVHFVNQDVSFVLFTIVINSRKVKKGWNPLTYVVSGVLSLLLLRIKVCFYFKSNYTR